MPLTDEVRADCEKLIGISMWYGDTPARVAKAALRLDAELAAIRDILQRLLDVQNGCPLDKYETEWNEVTRLAYSILRPTKEPPC